MRAARFAIECLKLTFDAVQNASEILNSARLRTPLCWATECRKPNAHRPIISQSIMNLDEMTAQREALLAARYRGLRTVETEGRRVTYATDAEMAAAIVDLERRIAATQEGGRKRRILTSASKGL